MRSYMLRSFMSMLLIVSTIIVSPIMAAPQKTVVEIGTLRELLPKKILLKFPDKLSKEVEIDFVKSSCSCIKVDSESFKTNSNGSELSALLTTGLASKKRKGDVLVQTNDSKVYVWEVRWQATPVLKSESNITVIFPFGDKSMQGLNIKLQNIEKEKCFLDTIRIVSRKSGPPKTIYQKSLDIEIMPNQETFLSVPLSSLLFEEGEQKDVIKIKYRMGNDCSVERPIALYVHKKPAISVSPQQVLLKKVTPGISNEVLIQGEISEKLQESITTIESMKNHLSGNHDFVDYSYSAIWEGLKFRYNVEFVVDNNIPKGAMLSFPMKIQLAEHCAEIPIAGFLDFNHIEHKLDTIPEFDTIILSQKESIEIGVLKNQEIIYTVAVVQIKNEEEDTDSIKITITKPPHRGNMHKTIIYNYYIEKAYAYIKDLYNIERSMGSSLLNEELVGKNWFMFFGNPKHDSCKQLLLDIDMDKKIDFALDVKSFKISKFSND